MSFHSKKLGIYLKSYRIRCGLTRNTVANILGYRNSTMIAKWENGTHVPGLIPIIMLAVLYGILIEELVKELFREIRAYILGRCLIYREEIKKDQAGLNVPKINTSGVTTSNDDTNVVVPLNG